MDLLIPVVHDRAHVLLDGVLLATLWRTNCLSLCGVSCDAGADD
jgi:hypothetical protein